MKKCIVIFSVILGSFSFGHSQTFNIFVEPGELFTATGTPISSSNQQGFNIFTAPYSVSTGDANDFFSTLEANLLSFDEVATGVEELKTFLGSHSWTSLTSSDISGIDFEASSVTTSEGSRPLLFITDASSFSEIGLGSQIGLAGATTTAGSFGLTNYAFNAGMGVKC